MVEYEIWSCPWMRRGAQAREHLADRRRWSGIIPVVALTSSIVCPWSGIAEESHPKAEPGSTGTAAISQSTSTPVGQEAPGGPVDYEVFQDNIAVLQDLLTSDARRKMAVDLGALIRQGSPERAKQMLSAIVDTGTLAFVITDYFERPAVRSWLQALAAEQENLPVQAPPLALTDNTAAVANTKGAELREILEQERARADTMQQELNAAQEQLAALKANEARAAELKEMLEQEKEHAASVTRELETVSGQLAGAKKNEAKAAELRDEAAREKDRANAAAAALSEAHSQVNILQVRVAEAAEFKTLFEQEKDHSTSLSRELEDVKAQLSAQRVNATKAAEGEDAARERQQADIAHQQLDILQEQLSALKAGGAKVQADLMQEKEQNALTARQLKATLGMIASLESRAEFRPGTLAFQDHPFALFEPLSSTAGDVAEQAPVKAGLVHVEQEATIAEPRAQDASLQVNVQPRMKVPASKVKSDIVQKRHLPNQRVTSSAQIRTTSGVQHRKHYSQNRRRGVWTGLMGGYGNTRKTRSNNAPGIW